MNKIAKKVWLSVLSVIVGVSALSAGVFALASNNKVAVADSAPTQVSFEIDGSSEADITLVQGQTITLTATVSTTRTQEYWNAVNVYFSVIKKDATEYNQTTVDTELSAKMSYVDKSANSNFTQIKYDEYETPYINYLTQPADHFGSKNKYLGLRLVVSFNQGDYRVGSDNCEITAKIKLADDIPVGSQFQFAMRAQADSNVLFREHNNTSVEMKDIASAGNLTANSFNVTIREASKDNTLKNLEVGHDSSALTSLAQDGANEGDPKVVPDASDYTFTHDDLESFFAKPTANDVNAKVEIALNDQVTFQEVTAEAPDQFTLRDPSTLTTPSDNTLYVKVTAENGNSKTYTVTVKIGYVRLSAITADASTATDGVTKKGLDLSATSDAFDKETFAYNVFVPSDYSLGTGEYTGVQISAAVLTGYGASNTVSLTPSGCEIDPDATTMESAGTIVLKKIKFPTEESAAAPTLTLTATASDGTTKQAYVLTLVEVSVDASLGSITVKGVEQTEKEFKSDEAQATEQSIDYYYLLTGETAKTAKVSLIATSDKASLAVAWTDSTVTDPCPEYAAPDTVYGEGGYTVTVTAEAGNTKTYKFILAAALYLRLAEDTSYAFIAEKELENVDELGSFVPYRVSYEQFGWVHGVDDLDSSMFEMIVLGQVKFNTCVNDFVKNLDPAQLSLIKIYAYNDESETGYSVIYNCGAVGDGYSESDLADTIDYAVATGWYITYGADDETADKVYISVLGDVTRDGLLDGGDTGNISSYLMERGNLDLLYVRLAARVFNDGYISGNDTSTLSSIIMNRGTVTIENYLTKYPTLVGEDEGNEEPEN